MQETGQVISNPWSSKFQTHAALVYKLLTTIANQISFRSSYTIGSFFKLKDRLPDSLCSCIIYSYKCVDCSSTYIGSSIRQFKCREYEHRNLSVRTLQPFKTERFSAILEHSRNKNHIIDNNSFKIISRCQNKYDIRYLEALHILKNKPNLNSGLPVDLAVVSI